MIYQCPRLMLQILGILLVTPVALVLYFSVSQFLLPLQNGNYFRFQTCKMCTLVCLIMSNSPGPLQARSMFQWFVSYETIVLKRPVFLNSHWLFYSQDSFRKVRANSSGLICSVLLGQPLITKLKTFLCRTNFALIKLFKMKEIQYDFYLSLVRENSNLAEIFCMQAVIYSLLSSLKMKYPQT